MAKLWQEFKLSVYIAAKLHEPDKAFAEFVFKYNGVLGVSKGVWIAVDASHESEKERYRSGKKFIALEGPLSDISDLQGLITHVNAHKRSCDVQWKLGELVIKGKLYFEEMRVVE